MQNSHLLIQKDIIDQILSEGSGLLSPELLAKVAMAQTQGVLMTPIVPVGALLMPDELTAENGAKSIMRGEFAEVIRVNCPDCEDHEDPDDECETCEGQGEYELRVDIEWTMIKDIYARAVKFLGKSPERLASNVTQEEFEIWYRKKHKIAESIPLDYQDPLINATFAGWIGNNQQYGCRPST